MFDSIQQKCNFPVTTLLACAANIWTWTQSDMFPLHHSDYLWRPAISVDEKQELSNMRPGEAWRVEAGPDDQPPSLSVCPVTGGNVWKRRQDSSGEPALSLLMTKLRTAGSAHECPWDKTAHHCPNSLLLLGFFKDFVMWITWYYTLINYNIKGL